MGKHKDPREEIKKMLDEGNLEELLQKAASLHGHYCSYLALGVRSTYTAFRELGISESSGMEEIVAVVECNNCFIDGIQAISGCTFGNNSMIYRDYGKTAVTFNRKKENEAIRISVKDYKETIKNVPYVEEAQALFDRAVKKREKLTSEESRRMKELWTALAFKILELPEKDIFKISKREFEKVEYAPIFDSAVCSTCGEQVMETRARIKENKILCIPCAGAEYSMVAGKGIHPARK